MHFVYILYSPSSDIYYVGESDNVTVRMNFHNLLNPHSFTSKHRPWSLKKTIPVSSRSIARKIERYIKKRKSRKFIISLINNDIAVQKLITKFSNL